MNNNIKYVIVVLVALIVGGLAGYLIAPKATEVSISEPKIATDSIPLDEAPDNELSENLNALRQAAPADTAFNSLIFNVDGQTVSVSDFIEFENNYSGIENKMRTQPTEAYKFLSSLPSNSIRVLELFELWRQQASLLARQDFKFLGQPKQTKIAYSWGSKQYKRRVKPSKYLGGVCEEDVHGLDCSGFIYQLFAANNILMPVTQAYADMERQPSFLMKCLKPFFSEEPFQVTDLGKIPIDNMQTGDIVYFRNKFSKKVSHIAIVLVNDQGTISLFQSLGGPSSCDKNLDTNHGPIVKVLAKGMEVEKRDYACVRISAHLNH